MTQVTDLYGKTYNYGSDSDQRQAAASMQKAVDKDKALLEAAQTGDYSKIMNAKDRYGQTLAGRSDASKKLKELQSAGNTILKKYNAVQGAKTGDYSGASRDNPMLLAGNDYDRVFNEGKGYAVYDSHTDAEGNQYLAVSGKNSSFIQKIDVDGNSTRLDNTSKISSMGFDAKMETVQVLKVVLEIKTSIAF